MVYKARMHPFWIYLQTIPYEIYTPCQEGGDR
jgi:hypothetical protein